MSLANRLKERSDAPIMRKLVMPILLLVLIVIFSIAKPDSFFTWYNFRNMLSQTAYIIVASVGLTFVMLAGGIDLSIGYQMSLTGMMVGMMMVNFGLPVWLSIVLTLLLGIVLGLFNGVICVKLGVFPMIITLSTSMVFQGLSFTISNARTILGMDSSFMFIGQGYIGPIPFSVIIAAVVVIVAMFILNRTYFGRYVYAIGGNEEAARLAGINTARIKIILYGLCGLFVALASLMLTSRSASASSNIGPGTEFDCLSGCILGGITLDGGEGSVGGMVIGAFIITVLSNGMQLLGLGTYPQYIVTGCVLIAAMGFDVYQKRKKVKKNVA